MSLRLNGKLTSCTQLTSLSSSRLRRSEKLISDFNLAVDPQKFGVRVNEKFNKLKLRYDQLSEKVILIVTSDGKSEVRSPLRRQAWDI